MNHGSPVAVGLPTLCRHHLQPSCECDLAVKVAATAKRITPLDQPIKAGAGHGSLNFLQERYET